MQGLIINLFLILTNAYRFLCANSRLHHVSIFPSGRLKFQGQFHVTNTCHIFTAKIATDLSCAQRRYPCNTSGFSRQCYSGPQGSHLPIYANPLWVSVSFAKLRPSGPALNFFPSHLPFGDACIFPLSLSYDPLPLQNLASHNLVSRRQSVVVLTVKMVYYLF